MDELPNLVPSTLDEKLKTVLVSSPLQLKGAVGMSPARAQQLIEEHHLKGIKRVFEEAGYRQAQMDVYGRVKLTGQECTHSELKDDQCSSEAVVQYSGSQQFYFAGDMEAWKKSNGLLTGKEWYDRFADLANAVPQATPLWCSPHEFSLDLAKKAAGLE